MIAVDATEVAGGVIAILQRPTADLPVALTAFAVSISPTLLFFFFNMKLSPMLMWATWSTGATWADVQIGDFEGDGTAQITGRALSNGLWWTGL